MLFEQKAELDRDTQVASADKDKQVNIATYTQEQNVAKENSDKQSMLAQKAKDLAEQEQNINIQEKQAELQKKEYDATNNAQADSALYVARQNAEAQKAQQVAMAEAEAKSVELNGDAEAKKTRSVGRAKAESTEKQALALAKMNEAGKLQMIINVLPQVAAEIAKPYASVDKIVQFGGGDDNMGNATANGMAKTFETLKEATGLDLAEILTGRLSNQPIVSALDEDSQLSGKSVDVSAEAAENTTNTKNK